MTKVHTSAIVIIPPEDQWAQIQSIRSMYDRAYARWMPHINLIYPFVPESEYEENAEKTVNALKDIKPFRLIFSEFDYFVQAKSVCTMHLKPLTEPPNALIDLQSKLFETFPFCNELSTRSTTGFNPHMTVGQFTGKVQADRQKKELAKSFKPIEFTVDRVYFISRINEDPFQIIKMYPLSTVMIQPENKAEEQNEPSTVSCQPELEPETKFELESELQTSGNDQDAATSLVAQRIVNWLHAQSEREKLPKTRDKLRVATRNLCIVTFQAITANEVIQDLKNKGYFSVDKKNGIKYHRKLKTPPSLDGPTPVQNAGSCANDIVIINRCIMWLYSAKNPPKTIDTLLISFEQLTKLRRMVDQDEVLLLLEKKGIIKFTGYDGIEYKI